MAQSFGDRRIPVSSYSKPMWGEDFSFNTADMTDSGLGRRRWKLSVPHLNIIHQ